MLPRLPAPLRFVPLFALSLLLLAACQPAATPEPPQIVTVIYDDAIAPGWQDWSWDTSNNLYSTANIQNGTQAIETKFNAFGGLSLRSETPIDPAQYTHISFWASAPDGEQPLYVFIQATDDGAESEKATITVGPQWQAFSVALADLGNPPTLKRINIQEATGEPVSVVYLDDLKLIGK